MPASSEDGWNIREDCCVPVPTGKTSTKDGETYTWRVESEWPTRCVTRFRIEVTWGGAWITKQDRVWPLPQETED